MPVLAVEAFVREHPGAYLPAELAGAVDLEPLVVAEIVAYLLVAGRIGLDDEGCLVWHE